MLTSYSQSHCGYTDIPEDILSRFISDLAKISTRQLLMLLNDGPHFWHETNHMFLSSFCPYFKQSIFVKLSIDLFCHSPISYLLCQKYGGINLCSSIFVQLGPSPNTKPKPGFWTKAKTKLTFNPPPPTTTTTQTFLPKGIVLRSWKFFSKLIEAK